MIERVNNRRKLEKLIAKLPMRTTAKGCTPAEEAEARDAVARLQKVSKDWNEG